MLEIGLGPGLFLKDFIAKFEVEPTNVIAVEESEKMLSYARTQLPSSVQLINTRFNLEYLQNLDKQFDLIFLGLLLHELPTISEILASFVDILNQGGYLVLLEHVIVPLQDYIDHQKKIKDKAKHEIINHYPHPAKFHVADITFLLKELKYELVSTTYVNPTTSLIIAKNKNE